jgi:hypothetical protein
MPTLPQNTHSKVQRTQIRLSCASARASALKRTGLVSAQRTNSTSRVLQVRLVRAQRVRSASLIACCVQWYNPSQPVPLAAADGREVMSYFVFEMDLDIKRSPGVIETKTKVIPLCVLCLCLPRNVPLIFSEMASLFASRYTVLSHGRSRRVAPWLACLHCGSSSAHPRDWPLHERQRTQSITWQLRPAHKNCDTGSVSSRVQRKRPFFESDEIDRINGNQD